MHLRKMNKNKEEHYFPTRCFQFKVAGDWRLPQQLRAPILDRTPIAGRDHTSTLTPTGTVQTQEFISRARLGDVGRYQSPRRKPTQTERMCPLHADSVPSQESIFCSPMLQQNDLEQNNVIQGLAVFVASGQNAFDVVQCLSKCLTVEHTEAGLKNASLHNYRRLSKWTQSLPCHYREVSAYKNLLNYSS